MRWSQFGAKLEVKEPEAGLSGSPGHSSFVFFSLVPHRSPSCPLDWKRGAAEGARFGAGVMWGGREGRVDSGVHSTISRSPVQWGRLGRMPPSTVYILDPDMRVLVHSTLA
jgi:hypothetical protein